MTYFKVTDLTVNDSFYISSPLPGETATHVAMSMHLTLDKDWKIEEVTAEEFYHGSEEESCGLLPRSYDDIDHIDLDCSDDWDWEDKDADADYNND